LVDHVIAGLDGKPILLTEDRGHRRVGYMAAFAEKERQPAQTGGHEIHPNVTIGGDTPYVYVTRGPTIRWRARHVDLHGRFPSMRSRGDGTRRSIPGSMLHLHGRVRPSVRPAGTAPASVRLTVHGRWATWKAGSRHRRAPRHRGCLYNLGCTVRGLPAVDLRWRSGARIPRRRRACHGASSMPRDRVGRYGFGGDQLTRDRSPVTLARATCRGRRANRNVAWLVWPWKPERGRQRFEHQRYARIRRGGVGLDRRCRRGGMGETRRGESRPRRRRKRGHATRITSSKAVARRDGLVLLRPGHSNRRTVMPSRSMRDRWRIGVGARRPDVPPSGRAVVGRRTSATAPRCIRMKRGRAARGRRRTIRIRSRPMGIAVTALLGGRVDIVGNRSRARIGAPWVPRKGRRAR